MTDQTLMRTSAADTPKAHVAERLKLEGGRKFLLRSEFEPAGDQPTAIAELARERVPEEVASAYGKNQKFGTDYIIPAPFDPRLISFIPPFVAQAAMDTGVARKPIEDMEEYRHSLARRLDPTASFLQGVQSTVRRDQKRIVFAEGEEPQVVRAAWTFSLNDFYSNAGILVAGALVLMLGSNWPDLVIGVVIAMIALKGGIVPVARKGSAVSRSALPSRYSTPVWSQKRGRLATTPSPRPR